jgi:hypothetical protein
VDCRASDGLLLDQKGVKVRVGAGLLSGRNQESCSRREGHGAVLNILKELGKLPGVRVAAACR